MKKNDEILKRFQFDLEIGVFKPYDPDRPHSTIFFLDENHQNYFPDYLILTRALDDLGYRRLKCSTGSISNYTLTGVIVNHNLKTFYTTDEVLFFMQDYVNEIPKYLLEGYSIVRKEGKDLFNYE